MDDLINSLEFYSLVKRRDQVACNQLYNYFSPAIFGQIFVSVKDTAIAEDLTQETFIKVYQRFEQFNPVKGRLYTWIVSIARNNCVDHHRVRKYKMRDVADTDVIYTADAVYHSIDAKRIRQRFSKFNTNLQLLLELIYIDGYTYEQASAACCIPVGTIKTRIRYVLKVLREEISAAH